MKLVQKKSIQGLSWAMEGIEAIKNRAHKQWCRHLFDTPVHGSPLHVSPWAAGGTTARLLPWCLFPVSAGPFWRAKHMDMKRLGCMGGGVTPSTTPCTECSGGAGQMQSGVDGFCTCKTGIEPCHTVPVYRSFLTYHAHSHMIGCSLLYWPVMSQMRYIWTAYRRLQSPQIWNCTLVSVYQYTSYFTWLESSSALL